VRPWELEEEQWEGEEGELNIVDYIIIIVNAHFTTDIGTGGYPYH
jgi:hypothetical protein